MRSRQDFSENFEETLKKIELRSKYKDSFAQAFLRLGIAAQVSDVASGPLVLYL